MAALQPPFNGFKLNWNALRQNIERCEYPPLPSDRYSVEVYGFTLHVFLSRASFWNWVTISCDSWSAAVYNVFQLNDLTPRKFTRLRHVFTEMHRIWRHRRLWRHYHRDSIFEEFPLNCCVDGICMSILSSLHFLLNWDVWIEQINLWMLKLKSQSDKYLSIPSHSVICEHVGHCNRKEKQYCLQTGHFLVRWRKIRWKPMRLFPRWDEQAAGVFPPQ